jgi:folate-binding protein YgfZ
MEPLPLHDWHRARGATFTELNGFEVVAHYADPEAEVRAALGGKVVFDWSARGVLKVTGPDRLEFLQGMCTADVKKLPSGGAYAAFLTNKGAMVADGRLWDRGEDVIIVTEPGFLPAVRDYLQKHLVSEEAEVSEAADLASVTALETELLVPRSELQEVLELHLASGATLAGFDAWEYLRVERGIPRYGRDMDDKTIPLEAGLQPLISYDKGCYVGQEVIARATFRGHVNRQLQQLAFRGDAAPAIGAVLRSGDKEVGRVTSVVKSLGNKGWIGLGYVHRDAAGSPLTLEGGGAVELRP